MKTDKEIKQSLIQELKWDTRVQETAIGVSVVDGVVTLSGSVSSWAERLAAQQAAYRVRGVLDVANDVEVHLQDGALRSDADIAKATRAALKWNALVPDQCLRSMVSRGWVTIEGEVEYGAQRSEAEKAVSHLHGVRGVTNNIRVKASMVTALNVREAIMEALERRADQDVSRIALEVDQGRVSLRGVVRSWTERTAAVTAARETQGVVSVEDHLSVRPWT
jgi:osmotically-inducible protein OsmY